MTCVVLAVPPLTYYRGGPRAKQVGTRPVTHGDRYDNRYLASKEVVYPLPINKTAEPYREPPVGVSSEVLR